MRRGLPLLLLLAAAAGCAGIGTQEIPEPPIAIYWFDAETFRKRAEAIEDAETGGPTARYGVAHVENVVRYLGDVVGQYDEDQRPLDARYPGRLALLDPRSEEVTPVPGAREGAIPRAWSPDRERLLYSQVIAGFRQLFEYRAATGEVRQLTRGRGVHPDGCYLPGGRYAISRVEVVDERPISRIAIAEPGVSNPVFVSQGDSSYAPACAPDGSAIAWVRLGERGRDTIQVQMPPGTGEIRSLGLGIDPAFSADGEWIVYSAPSGREGQRLMRVRPDGSGRKTIGQSTLLDLQPSLSPDGRLVVYVADDGYNRRFHVRRFDGSGDRVLLRDGGGEHPIWQ